ncbi:hypothetical protein C8R46DRAFT_1113831 [Mycena filopes]|nr:hypothetical protein C8R46DRAFT_1113831 [Mycena filopes]
MPSTSGPPPILQIRQAAATAASARSPTRSLSSDDQPRKETFRLIAPAPHTERSEKQQQQQLYIDVEGAAPLGDAKIEATLVLAPVGLSPQETKHSQHVVHFKFPIQEEIVSSPVKHVFPRAHIDTVPASPAPTHRSLHSGSSHASSSDVNTLSSASHSTADANATPMSPASGSGSERRRSHKLRFSKLVHMFTDKHGHGQESKARRRDSVSELRAEATPLSPAVPPAEEDTAEDPARSPPRRQRSRHRSLIRTVSCPILHYTHPHERTSRPRSRSPPPPVPPLPAIPASPTSPVTPRSPRRAKTQTRKASLKKEKEVVPRPRTQPYAAPYFIPPPDSADVEEPLVKRRPSRRRTAEGLGA